MRIITIGIGTEKGGTIPLKKNGIVESYQRDNNGEVVVTKLNRASLETIAKTTKGGYINGNNTKDVLAYIKATLDKIQKTEFESTQMADFQSQFQWFLGFGFVLLFLDLFLLEKKTNWVKKLNLFNEEK
jgi:Ca-activated chloride channel family protein